MGFFSKVRKRIKKIIPKEVRPFVPYMAAGMLPPGALGLGNLNPWMQKAIIAGGTRFATDDEADLKDIGITAALAGAPDALGQYGETGKYGHTLATKGADYAKANPWKTGAAMGSTDAAIKQVELNEDALAKYNADLARQGIADRTARRSAIRQIYENTGTWDMDEVDTMLDTYGYRTGGRVGYEHGGTDWLPWPSYKGHNELEEERYRDMNDKELKAILEKEKTHDNRKEDTWLDFDLADLILDERKAKEIGGEYYPFLGLDYRKKDAGLSMLDEVQQYKYGTDQPDREEGAVEPVSMEDAITDLENKWDAAIEEGYEPGKGGEFDYLGIYEKEDIRRRIELGWDQAKGPITDTGIMKAAHGGRVGLYNGSNPKRSGKKKVTTMKELLEKHDQPKDNEEDEGSKARDDIPMTKVVKEAIFNEDDTADDLEMAVQGYNILYPETPENRIRPLSFADGGSTSNYSKLMARVKELQDEGLDFGSAMQQAIKELGTPFARGGGVMDGLDINLREQIDTPTGDEMIDENIEVADSTLMDAYEIYKFEMLEQGLEPMSLEQFRDQAIAESKMASAGSWESEWEDIYQNYKAKQIELGQEFVSKEEFMEQYQDNMASGGRVGYDEGGIGKWVKKKIKKKIKPYTKEGRDEFKKEWLEKKNIDMTVKEWNALSLKEKAKIWFREGSAQGGRIGYRFGEEVQTEKGSIEGHRAGPEWFTKRVEQLMYEGYSYEEASEIAYEEGHGGGAAKGGRIGAQEGGLMNLGGREMDLRGGGFVPIGKKERADDVPARLSKNEFVMTADAVRAAGGGNVQKGSHLMYDQMKQLEGQA